MKEVTARTQNLQFANKTLQDLKMLVRVDEVAALMEALEKLPQSNPLKNHPAYQAVAKRHYVRVPKIVAITRPQQVECFGGSDFSPQTIEERASEGYKQTDAALLHA
jgi:Patatin phospholipase